jgi:hypothetical protein
VRKPQQRGKLPGRQPPRSGTELHPYRPGERGPHLGRDRRQVGGARLRRVDSNGQRHAATLEARERAHDRVAGRLPVEHDARARPQDDGLQAAQDDRRVAVRAVDGPSHASHLVDERPLEHASRRRDVRAEHPHADPPEAAQRPDPGALVERQLDGRVPVRLDAEADRLQSPLVPGGGEGERGLRERVRAALQLRARLVRGQPADVDAVDADARGDPGRRAGEDESEHDAAHRGDDREHHQPLNEQRPGTAASSTAGPDPSGPCLDAQGTECSGAVRT